MKLKHINCVKLAFDTAAEKQCSQMGQMVEPGSLSCSVGKKEFDRTLSGINWFSDCDCVLVTDLSGDIMFWGGPSVHYFWCCIFFLE